MVSTGSMVHLTGTARLTSYLLCDGQIPGGQRFMLNMYTAASAVLKSRQKHRKAQTTTADAALPSCGRDTPAVPWGVHSAMRQHHATCRVPASHVTTMLGRGFPLAHVRLQGKVEEEGPCACSSHWMGPTPCCFSLPASSGQIALLSSSSLEGVSPEPWPSGRNHWWQSGPLPPSGSAQRSGS